MTSVSGATLARRQNSTGVPFAIAFGFALASSSAVGGGLPAFPWTTTPVRAEFSSVRIFDPNAPAGRTGSGVPDPQAGLPNDTSASPAQRVAELRELSGLTTDQVGRLFGVSRRSVHNWINGNSMAPQHEERSAKILALVQVLPGSTPDERRAALLDSRQGTSLFHQLVAANNDGERLQVAGLSARERIAQ